MKNRDRDGHSVLCEPAPARTPVHPSTWILELNFATQTKGRLGWGTLSVLGVDRVDQISEVVGEFTSKGCRLAAVRASEPRAFSVCPRWRHRRHVPPGERHRHRW